jgi:hypothetical protein
MPDDSALPLPDHAGAPALFGAFTVLPFVADIRQFVTAASLAAYLDTLPRPDWPGDGPVGSTAHNTYRPTAAQWSGRASMDSMVTTYKAKTPVAWDRGPHFYFVVGAPNPKHNGIWMMTPPSVPGIHAGDCNKDYFGCELVGDYQSSAPPAALQTLFLDGLAVLHRWARIGAVLNAHRDCMPGRTCPGDALYAIVPRLQVQLAVRLAAAPLPPAPPPGLDWVALWGPVAPPDQTSWAWSIPQLWKVHHLRLGPCIATMQGDDAHGLVVQCFQGGDIRGRIIAGKTSYEVCFR